MERKAVSGIMLTLLLISMLTLAFNVQPAKAEATIYIKADGRVDPPTAPILNVGNVTYTFTANINEPIVVQRSNIIIDGNGYTLQGTGSGKGFYLWGINHVTIKKTTIKGFYWGVYLDSSSYNNISGNNIKNNGYCGVWLDESPSNIISGNNIANNGWYGVWLFGGSNNNAVSRNNITSNLYGVYLWGSNNNAVSRNNIRNNSVGVQLYWSSNNNAVSGNNISINGWYGVYLWGSNNNSVSGNNLTSNLYGVFLGNDSYYNTLSGNNIINNAWFGFYLNYSYYNTLYENNLIDNWGCGIWTFGSYNNEIHHNNFINNEKQVATSNSTNVWDGNYWSNYTGVDNYSGPYQNETGSDGVGDTPHIIDATNKDRYPLMNPWPSIQTQFTLSTLYKVKLYVNGTLTYGSSLKVRFYSYSRVYQGVVTLWTGTTPRRVLISMNITHPLNKAIENVTLVLTDGAGTTLETLTTFLVRRPHLFGRIRQIITRWPLAPSAERIALFKELVDISKQWPYAPP